MSKAGYKTQAQDRPGPQEQDPEHLDAVPDAGIHQAHVLLIDVMLRARPALAGRARVVLLVAAVLGATAPAAVAAEPVPGELLVGFERGASGSERAAARRDAGVTVERALRVDGVQLVKCPPGESTEEAMERLERDPAVAFAEPTVCAPHRRRCPTTPASAPGAWMPSTRQKPGTSPTGNGSVVVGVIDTGVNYNHPDLAANIWTNPGEIPGNSVDDDGNGYKTT